jgi:EmrB/QacA subfamily drug resistance transporter
VACVVFINVIDVTILNVAIPTIQRELGAGEAAIQWLVAGYAALYGILIMTGGRLGDIFGYRRVLNAGLVAFVLTSLLCGLAQDPLMLIASRLAQGAAAALMTPQVSSVVQLLYPPRERVGILGVFGVLGGVAAVAGPLIGGLLIEANLFGLGWRMIFLVNVPLGLALIVGAMRFLPAQKSPLSPRMDIAGTVLVTATFGAVLVPLVEGRALGWPAWCLVLLAVSPLTLAVTVRYSRRRMRHDGSAMLVPDLFAEKAFALGIGLSALFQATMGGTLFILTLALQNGLSFSPGDVGLVHAPFAVGVATGVGVLARKILPRLGASLVMIGVATTAAGLCGVSWQIWSGVGTLWPYFPTMAVMGLGCGMILGSVAPITLSEVDTNYAGAASGTLKSLQELGGAAGVAVVGGIFLSLSQRELTATSLSAFAWASGFTLLILVAIALVALSIPSNLKVFARD